MTPFTPDVKRKPIRSFVRREGRLTIRQKKALNHDTPFLIQMDTHKFDLNALFGRTAPTVLEIGFGMGQALLEMAIAFPHHNFIGIDIYRPGIATVLANIEENSLQNIRILEADAQEALPTCFSDDILDAINIFFPDPWPKKRHHKRRLIQSNFVAMLVSKLKMGGRLHLATDWEDYALQMLDVLNHEKGLANASPTQGFSTSRQDRPLTKYEKRGVGLGHGVWDLIFIKKQFEE